MSVGICIKCERKWTGLAEAHCPTCHNHFTSVGNFDSHRRNDQCIQPSEVRSRDGAPKLRPVTRAHGIAWGSADERPDLFA